jgi:hypothetical protein
VPMDVDSVAQRRAFIDKLALDESRLGHGPHRGRPWRHA